MEESCWTDAKNTSLAEVRRTLRHKSCHVFVDWKEPEEHGLMFRACTCMERFDRPKK